ncbi:aspartic peptidase domain-containing protein [Dipodascopsis tothii]|uniref:aspartic peptidase domain-containing protein n=1 Tax=Dipodascopsis tothii TaxID=44089 RepID=UPI0034CF342E
MFFRKVTIGLAVVLSAVNADVIQLGIQKDYGAAQANHLHKRNTAYGAELENGGILYYTNITVGTPPQDQRVEVNTALSLLYVLTSDDPVCATEPCLTDLYDTSESKTYVPTDKEFQVLYVDGDNATGIYCSDAFSMGGIQIPNITFAAANYSTKANGALGLGFGDDGFVPFLVKNGYISSQVYSVWLNDADATEGEIVFGGFDKSRYLNDLHVIDMVPPLGSSDVADTRVNLTYINTWNTSLSESVGMMNALLISATTDIYVPQVVYDGIVNHYFPSDNQTADLFCDELNEDAEDALYFQFGDFAIEITKKLLFPPVEISNGFGNVTKKYQDGREICALAVSVDDESVMLGIAFLRAAYTVIDLDSQKVGLAQAYYGTVKSNFIEVNENGIGGYDGAAGLSLQTVTATATRTIITSSPTNVATWATTAVNSTAGVVTSAHASSPALVTTSASASASASAKSGASTARIEAMLALVTIGTVAFVALWV